MIRTLITLLALTGSAHAASTAAVHVFPPAGGTVPVGLSLTTPLPLKAPVGFALRGDLLLFPGLNVPPALSALLIAELPNHSALTPYAGVGVGTASRFRRRHLDPASHLDWRGWPAHLPERWLWPESRSPCLPRGHRHRGRADL